MILIFEAMRLYSKYLIQIRSLWTIRALISQFSPVHRSVLKWKAITICKWNTPPPHPPPPTYIIGANNDNKNNNNNNNDNHHFNGISLVACYYIDWYVFAHLSPCRLASSFCVELMGFKRHISMICRTPTFVFHNRHLWDPVHCFPKRRHLTWYLSNIRKKYRHMWPLKVSSFSVNS